MANQIIVTQSGNVQVSIEPPANVQVQISRAAIGTVSNVPTANFANFAGNVTVSAQPNITSLGTLTGLTVSGNSTVNNLTVTGNLVAGNLVANSANYANFAGVANTANTVAGANVTGVVANATFATSAGTANSATVANTANSVALANVSGAGNIASINLDGNVANLLTGLGTFVAIPTVSANANYANFANIANTANSVAVANVSGIGNIATVNLDGNASNILFGNGIFSAIPAVSNVANANYANFAGTAFSVSGSNVSGEVANAAYANAANTANLATYATTANSVAGANVSGEVANAAYANAANTANLATFATTANAVAGANVSGAVAYATVANSVSVGNVSGIGNISTINIDGNLGNVLYGNGVFAAVVAPTSVANANYANFAGTAFSVAGSNVSGEVANAAYANAANTANLATYATTANSVAGANVSGTVANATFALDAGNSNLANTANSVAVANVSGIGNIATVNLDGNASNILYGNGVFATTPIISNVANANYANFAGTAFSVSGSNVSGEVANAAYANIAGVANSVAGANVSGTVANANYSAFANVAASANSVAVANVSGIGNIATVNLDGSSSNVLFGNGVFAPESTSIANANYANFAGTAFSVSGSNVSGEVANANYSSFANIAASANSVAVGNVSGIGNIATINLDGNASNALLGNGSFGPVEVQSTSIANGTSNINIPVANGTIAFSVNNTANLVMLENGGVVNAFPTSSVVNMLRINTFNNSLSDAHRVAWARARGSNTSPTSVQGSDRLGILSFFGHNGSNYQTNSVSLIRATVDSSYTANGANIPIGLQLIVNDTNGGVNNQAKVHNFYANGNVNFANSVVVTDSLSVTGNVTSANANLGNLATANFITGTLTTNAQPNITSLGNLPYLQVSNSANADGVVNQLSSGNITFATATANVASYQVTTLYHPNNSTAYPAERIIRSRGNATTPTTAISADRILNKSGLAYNGTVNPISVNETWTVTGTVNANANAQYTGGQINWLTGNPTGDTANQGNSSWQNQLIFTNSGSLQINPGGPANTSLGQASSSLLITNYGASTTSLVNAGGLNFQRARGNRDSQSNVAAGDHVGRSVFIAYSNGAYQSSNVAQYRVVVDSTYVANDVIVPMSHQFVAVANVAGSATFRTTSLYANGTTALPGNINFTASTANLLTGTSGQIALGISAGSNVQGAFSVAIGRETGETNQGTQSLAVGYRAGRTNQSSYALAFGDNAGANAQSQYAVAIGQYAGANLQGNNSVAFGTNAGGESQGNIAVAIGSGAGQITQGASAVAIGQNAGQNNQGAFSVAAGINAGYNNQGTQSVALGYYAGANTQGQYSVAIGRQAGEFTQGANSFALGYAAGSNNQGNNSIAIGYAAGYANQANNSIILNATGSVLNQTTANTFTVKPVRNLVTGNVVFYNNSSGEISYDTLANNTSNISAGNINVTGSATLNSINTGNIQSDTINTGNSGISTGNTFNIKLDNNTTQGILQTTYNNANIQTGQWTSWRQRGTQASPLGVQAGDEISKFGSVVYADSGNSYYLGAEQTAAVISNDGAGNVATDYRIRVYGTGSKFSVMAPKLTVADTNDFGANATIYANGYISTVDRLDYLRTFGSFTSNATQTNSNVGNAVYMTLNNDEGSNGVSIVSSSQITVARTGRYNLQFSAQLEKTDSGTDQVEIWLTKNGSAVANSATQLELAGNGAKAVAAWNWVDNVTSANTYYQIAWGSSDANVQLTAIPSANTLSGVAVPSLIVTVVPVGA